MRYSLLILHVTALSYILASQPLLSHQFFMRRRTPRIINFPVVWKSETLINNVIATQQRLGEQAEDELVPVAWIDFITSSIALVSPLTPQENNEYKTCQRLLIPLVLVSTTYENSLFLNFFGKVRELHRQYSTFKSNQIRKSILNL